MKQLKNQKGFTLVEIAIVLVIIGLLLGGVLKGQELIQNAKVKRLVDDMKGTQAMLASYQDRYRALPGDDLTAATRFPVLGASPAATNGNGNGLIAGGKFDNAAVESKSFWQHVRRANLATGSAAIPSTVAATYLPGNPYGGVYGVNSTLNIIGLIGSMSVCANNVPGDAAIRIDQMADDGVSNTGTIMVRANIATGAATNNNAAATAPPLALATAYTVCWGI
jgi:prepilin-type N-terminal cleavage/methylation domain-containing protein